MREVYVVSAVRTAIAKAKRVLAQYRPEDLGATVVREAVARAGIDGTAVQDVVLGCAFPEGEQGLNLARIVALSAGLPVTTPAMTINRFCSSGLEATAIAAAKIRAGLLDVAVAGGVESMSLIPLGGLKYAPHPDLVMQFPDIYINMGNAGDNVACDFGITREEADAWALQSHQRALSAIDSGAFKNQIVPLTLPDGSVFDTDDGPRRDTTLENLSKLKPAFAVSPKRGVCTAGNSSQMSDGAAALCLASGEAMKRYGLKPLAKFLGYAVAAGDPKYLGPAQLEAIPKACAMSGITAQDVDLFENNEAFATQCLYVIRELHLNPAQVNAQGGAIALGHPLGCTGAKLSTQLIHALHAGNHRYGVVTMCIGGGMGAAGVFECYASTEVLQK